MLVFETRSPLRRQHRKTQSQKRRLTKYACKNYTAYTLFAVQGEARRRENGLKLPQARVCVCVINTRTSICLFVRDDRVCVTLLSVVE